MDDKQKDEKGKEVGPAPLPEEETERSKIEELLDQGFTPKQIEKEWGFPYTTVYMIARKRLEPKGQPKGANGDDALERLPTVLKAGSGQEVISPEAIMQRYTLGDGQAGEWMLKGMMLLRAAQMMVLTDVEIMKGQSDAQSKAIKPILDIMEQSRKDMDAAAQRARESNVEIADRAAYETASEIVEKFGPELDAIKSSVRSTSTDPVTRAVGMIQSAQQLMGMFGFPMGQMGGQQPPPGQQQPWQPPPIKRKSVRELKEEENV